MQDAGTGLLESLKRATSTLLAIVSTRLELLANELEEERLRLSRMFLYAVFALACFGMGILLLTLFIIVLFWDEHRLLAIGMLCLCFFGVAAAMGLLLRSRMRERPALFSASLAEFARDREHLGAREHE